MQIRISNGVEILEVRVGRYVELADQKLETEPQEAIFVFCEENDYVDHYMETIKDTGAVEFTGSVKDVK